MFTVLMSFLGSAGFLLMLVFILQDPNTKREREIRNEANKEHENYMKEFGNAHRERMVAAKNKRG